MMNKNSVSQYWIHVTEYENLKEKENTLNLLYEREDKGIKLFSEERLKQIQKYGFTGKHHANRPNGYDDGQLVIAANYLTEKPFCSHNFTPKNWDEEWFDKISKKPYEERLIIAATFLVAEFDRQNYLKKMNTETSTIIDTKEYLRIKAKADK